jgi:hypothetical protein
MLMKLSNEKAKLIFNILVMIMLLYAFIIGIFKHNYLMAILCLFLLIIYVIKNFKK